MVRKTRKEMLSVEYYNKLDLAPEDFVKDNIIYRTCSKSYEGADCKKSYIRSEENFYKAYNKTELDKRCVICCNFNSNNRNLIKSKVIKKLNVDNDNISDSKAISELDSIYPKPNEDFHYNYIGIYKNRFNNRIIEMEKKIGETWDLKTRFADLNRDIKAKSGTKNHLMFDFLKTFKVTKDKFNTAKRISKIHESMMHNQFELEGRRLATTNDRTEWFDDGKLDLVERVTKYYTDNGMVELNLEEENNEENN